MYTHGTYYSTRSNNRNFMSRFYTIPPHSSHLIELES